MGPELTVYLTQRQISLLRGAINDRVLYYAKSDAPVAVELLDILPALDAAIYE